MIVGIKVIMIKMIIFMLNVGNHIQNYVYKNKNKEKTNAMVLRYDDIEGRSNVYKKVNCLSIQKVEYPQDIEEKIIIIPPQNSNQENQSRLHC